MSREDLQKFLEAVRGDSALQAKVQAEGADIVAIAHEAGFSVTKAELLRQQAGHAQELSDEELEGVAGGFAMVTVTVVFSMNLCGTKLCGK